MSKSPFYRVTVRRTGRDLSDSIDSLTYEDCTEEDDIVKLSFRNVDMSLLDDADLLPGVELVFVFGFIGEESSPRRICQISTVEPSYGKTIDLSITATDAGYVMKKDTSDKVWKNVTASAIAQQIATNNGLGARVTPTAHTYDNLPQGNKTDWEFLKYVCSIETDGSYRFYIKDKVLIFEPLNLKKASARTFIYGGEFGNIISFKPKINQNTKAKGSIKTTAVSTDPFTGTVNRSTADNSTVKDDTKLGGNVLSFDAGSKLLGGVIKSRVAAVPATTKEAGNGQTVMGGPASQTELDNLTNKEKKSGSASDITASLEVLADPNFIADSIVTIKSVAQIHGGNWYVAKVVHSLSKGGYKMTMELKKNATNKKTGESATGSVNKTVGSEGKTPSSKVVYKYNANSQLK